MDRRIRSNSRLTRKALIIQYDGTNYCGWQIQNKDITVQYEIEKALKILYKEDIKVIASGRTDSGVHAFGQVAHFDSFDTISLNKLCTGLNGILPKDIAIKKAYVVPASFHARFDAFERSYIYYIYNDKYRSPFTKNRYLWVKDKLNLTVLRKMSKYLIGEHDFASFCKKKSSDEITIRNIKKIHIIQQGPCIEVKIIGNAFLHNMIRIIVGTLIDLCLNKNKPSDIKHILEAKTREASSSTAAACGLYLYRVDYKPSLEKIALESVDNFIR